MFFDGLENINYSRCTPDDLIQMRRAFSFTGDDLDEATSHLRALIVGDQNRFTRDEMRSFQVILARLEHMRYERYQAFKNAKNPPVTCDVCGTIYTSAVCPNLYKTHDPL